jgi:hypothetical protein
VQRADALSGARGNSNLQASVAQGIQSAGENGGAAGLMGVGMASGMMGIGNMQQPVAPPAPAADDPIAKLKKAKEMLDLGLITQADYDAARPRHWACNPRIAQPPCPTPHPAGATHRPGLAAGRATGAGQLPGRPRHPARPDPRRIAGARSGRHRHRRGGAEGRRQPLPQVRRHRHQPAPGHRPADLPVLPQRMAWRNGWRRNSASARAWPN